MTWSTRFTPIPRLPPLLESHRAALTWLIERGRAAEASEIAWGLKYFWLIRGHAAEGLHWYEQILNLPRLRRAIELRALAGATVLWYTQGQLDRARSGLDRIMTLADRTSDIDVVAQAEHLFGHVEHAAGNVPAARGWFASSLEAFRAL